MTRFDYHWKVTPGDLASLIALATFTDIHIPLTHLEDRFEGIDVDFFLSAPSQPGTVNSFNAGRALERIGNADYDRIYETLALSAIKQAGIPTQRLHADTTTISFYGEYDIDTSHLSEEEQKERPPSQDVLAYMIRQSFKPGEVTPEQANEIGYVLALEFTKGQHQFIVATHTDKSHIHNHVLFNSVTLDCDRKFANPHQCGRDVARISDRLCREHGLSVVENPKQKGKSYKEWDAPRKRRSWKGRLQETIDRVLPGRNASCTQKRLGELYVVSLERASERLAREACGGENCLSFRW